VGLEWPCRGWNGPVGALRAQQCEQARLHVLRWGPPWACGHGGGGLARYRSQRPYSVCSQRAPTGLARSAPTAFARSAPPGLPRPSGACSPRAPPGLARCAPLRGFHGPPGLARRAPPGLARSAPLQGLLAAPLQGFHGTPGGPALFVAYKEALSQKERASSFEQKVVMRGVVRYPPFYNTTKLKSQSVRGVGISLLEAYMIANCLSILVRTILLELNY